MFLFYPKKRNCKKLLNCVFFRKDKVRLLEWKAEVKFRQNVFVLLLVILG